jgi:hypothetical protein
VTVIRGVTVTINVQDMTPEEARAWIRRVIGPPRRVLDGTEKEHMLTVFRLLEPFETSNNQRSFTEEYRHANKIYHVHYFEGETEVEEILQDEES